MPRGRRQEPAPRASQADRPGRGTGAEAQTHARQDDSSAGRFPMRPDHHRDRPTAGRTEIVRTQVRLADAKRELEAGSWKPAIAASCGACELLRKMPNTVNPAHSRESCQSARRSSWPSWASSPRGYSITTLLLDTLASTCGASRGTGRTRCSRSGQRRAWLKGSSRARDDSTGRRRYPGCENNQRVGQLHSLGF